MLYPLEAPPEGGWVGLSEITAHGDYAYIVERDNQIGDKAKLKQVTRVPVADLEPGKLGEANCRWSPRKWSATWFPISGPAMAMWSTRWKAFAITADGTAYAITDNDGVDDSSGETHLLTFKVQ